MSDRVTLATTTGPLFVALASHYAAGLVAIVTGFAALVVAKGGVAHKRIGITFAYAMLYMGVTASGIAMYEGKSTSVVAAMVVGYMVITATTTVKPLRAGSRPVDLVMMVVAFTIAALNLWTGYVVLGSPGRQLNGVPAGMMLFMGTVFLLAGVGDARMIRAGGLTGARRIARHLWRMCFALFIASGSFFLGQMNFVPEPIRIVPLLFALGLAPLVVLLYWMWRVRLRKRLAGMILSHQPAVAK
ncbi:MAG: hypothetical protein H7066_08675 [Cytophagaceae bacterium]|nr:hypothetical protein [Gemmatimonadaceae bacterium]